MAWGLLALGAFICFLCGAAAGQAGMVTKKDLEQARANTESYREMWMKRVSDNSNLCTEKLRLENEVCILQYAIRQSRREFDEALPLEIKHVSA
jgi:hypothetical protein